MAVGKIDMTFPAPAVSVRVTPQHANEALIAVRFGDLVSLSFLNVIFH